MSAKMVENGKKNHLCLTHHGWEGQISHSWVISFSSKLFLGFLDEIFFSTHSIKLKKPTKENKINLLLSWGCFPQATICCGPLASDFYFLHRLYRFLVFNDYLDARVGKESRNGWPLYIPLPFGSGLCRLKLGLKPFLTMPRFFCLLKSFSSSFYGRMNPELCAGDLELARLLSYAPVLMSSVSFLLPVVFMTIAASPNLQLMIWMLEVGGLRWPSKVCLYINVLWG